MNESWPDSAKFAVSILAIILVTLVVSLLNSGGNDNAVGDVDPDDVVEVMDEQPPEHREVEEAFWAVWGTLTQAERTDACAYYLIDPDTAIAEMEFHLEHYGYTDELHELLTTACGEL